MNKPEVVVRKTTYDSDGWWYSSYLFFDGIHYPLRGYQNKKKTKEFAKSIAAELGLDWRVES